MYLHRFIVGIRFSKKMFRLPSLGGVVIDELLKLQTTEKKLGDNYFSQIGSTVASHDAGISLNDDKLFNKLTILPEQVIFKKTSEHDNAAVSVDGAIEEFKILFNAANKILDFPEMRRLGFVGELRLSEKYIGKAGLQLIEGLTKFSPPEGCGRFQLNFEDRNLTDDGVYPDNTTGDFWNKLYTFYNSDIDETPEKGKINANIDLQKYYNPTKSDPIKELKIMRKKFGEEKTKFKKNIKNMGFVD